VIVNKALVRDALGLEPYYQYSSDEVGGGMRHLVNVANGNSILRWEPFSSPGRGLDTTLDLTYNALEKKCECQGGNNWSVGISTLTRFGNPIDTHPNNADSIAGRSNKFIEYADADGTSHRFTDSNSDGYWEAPAGQHLYLRVYSTTDPAKKWALTAPDRVTYFYDVDGYPTSVADKNGNTITFTETPVAPADDPGGVRKHITAVTDAGGRAYTVTYWTKADAKKPQVRGKIKRITDHSGHPLDFDYYEDGSLLRVTERGGTKSRRLVPPRPQHRLHLHHLRRLRASHPRRRRPGQPRPQDPEPVHPHLQRPRPARERDHLRLPRPWLRHRPVEALLPHRPCGRGHRLRLRHHEPGHHRHHAAVPRLEVRLRHRGQGHQHHQPQEPGDHAGMERRPAADQGHRAHRQVHRAHVQRQRPRHRHLGRAPQPHDVRVREPPGRHQRREHQVGARGGPSRTSASSRG
jgi:hypothetical protein